MSATESQLRIPDSAVDDPTAFEVARVWVAHGAEHVTLRFDAWKNPAAWGIVLADLMRHLVNAYEQDMGLDRDATTPGKSRNRTSPPVRFPDGFHFDDYRVNQDSARPLGDVSAC
jgi:Domain of unknown function (DUF5076)